MANDCIPEMIINLIIIFTLLFASICDIVRLQVRLPENPLSTRRGHHRHTYAELRYPLLKRGFSCNRTVTILVGYVLSGSYDQAKRIVGCVLPEHTKSVSLSIIPSQNTLNLTTNKIAIKTFQILGQFWHCFHKT